MNDIITHFISFYNTQILILVFFIFKKINCYFNSYIRIISLLLLIIVVRMKLKQPRETPSRLRELEMRDTPPIQQKTKAVRYADD